MYEIAIVCIAAGKLYVDILPARRCLLVPATTLSHRVTLGHTGSHAILPSDANKDWNVKEQDRTFPQRPGQGLECSGL